MWGSSAEGLGEGSVATRERPSWLRRTSQRLGEAVTKAGLTRAAALDRYTEGAREAAPRPALLPERLHNLEAEKVRDLLTDASERLPAYMENTFAYTLSRDGRDFYSDTGESLNDTLDGGLRAAEQAAAIDPRWENELVRRRLEKTQHQATLELAQTAGGIHLTSFSLDGGNLQEGWFGESPLETLIRQLSPAIDLEGLKTRGQLDPDKVLGKHFAHKGSLVFISMTPLQVRESGRALDGAYDPHRLKTLVRVATPFDAAEQVGDITAEIRRHYDAMVKQKFGKETYGGRPIPKVTAENALDFILRQPHLIDQHLIKVQEILAAGLDSQQLPYELDKLQYNFVAAIDALLDGVTHATLEEAGAVARAAGKTFDGDCPSRQLTAEEQLRLAGMMSAKKPCCPFCNSPNFKVDPLDPVCGDKSCNNCGSEVVNGRVVKRQRHLGKAASTQVKPGRAKSRRATRRPPGRADKTTKKP